MSLSKAVVVGVGAEDGLGAALCRCYATNDRHVLVAGRSLEKVEKVDRAWHFGLVRMSRLGHDAPWAKA